MTLRVHGRSLRFAAFRDSSEDDSRFLSEVNTFDSVEGDGKPVDLGALSALSLRSFFDCYLDCAPKGGN